MRRYSPAGRSNRDGNAAGSALLLCLVLLTSLTLLGLAAASDRQLQMRIAANVHRAAEARMIAENALEWAEDWLFGLPGDARPVPCAGPCSAGQPVWREVALPYAAEHMAGDWWMEYGHQAGLEPVSGTVLDPPLALERSRWLVAEIEEEAEETPSVAYYRILAWGQDREGLHTAISESIVARPWGDSTWSDTLPLEPASGDFCREKALATCGRLNWRQRR